MSAIGRVGDSGQDDVFYIVGNSGQDARSTVFYIVGDSGQDARSTVFYIVGRASCPPFQKNQHTPKIYN